MIPYGAKRFAIKNGRPRASGDDPFPNDALKAVPE